MRRSLQGVRLEELPNVGPAVARTLRTLGFATPQALRGRDPYAMYETLNRRTGRRHDPCLLDTFIAVVRYVDGDAARPWWSFTAERKKTLAAGGSPSMNRGRRRTPIRAASLPSAETMQGLRNIGPASARMLAEAGITSLAQLRRAGAVGAFRRVRAREARASLNLLWALEGALSGRSWQAVARSERTRLLLALDDGPPRS